jgi:hypothetical protein
MHGVFHVLQAGLVLQPGHVLLPDHVLLLDHVLLGVAEAEAEATAQLAAIADQDLLSEEIEAQLLKIDHGVLHPPSQGSIVDLRKAVLKRAHHLEMTGWLQPKMGLITVMVLE